MAGRITIGSIPLVHLCLAVLCFPVLFGRPATAAPVEADIVRVLEQEMARSPLPGLAVAVTQDDRTIHLGGYGEAAPGVPMTAETPMMVGSVSKSFTAVAVLELVEQGLVNLDAPVQDYIAFTTADPQQASQVTVRHLLNHTSGLTDRGFPGLWDLSQDTPAERTRALSSARPTAAPGTEYHYFNPNYEVLADLVETVSGQGFDQFLQDEVLAPLALQNTTSVVRAEDAQIVRPALAQGHLSVFAQPVAYEAEGYVAGSGGVVTTAADMARWLKFHTGHPEVGQTPVLTPELLAQSHDPPGGIDSTYAMGWYRADVEGIPVVQHDGVLATSYAFQVFVPDGGYGIALLSNSNHAFTDVPRIADALVAELGGHAPPTPLMTHERIVWIFVALIAADIIVRTVQLRRSRLWAEQRTLAAPSPAARARTYAGIIRLALPVLVLAALPTLVAWSSGRVFTYRLLTLATPELVAWLGVMSITAVVLAVARMVALRGADVNRTR